MELGLPIFADRDTPIDRLLESVGAGGWHALAEEVSIEQAAQAIEGEMWAPQLTPRIDLGDDADDILAGFIQEEESHDLWRLREGIPDEIRERIAERFEQAKQARQAELAAQRAAQETDQAREGIDWSLVFGVKETAEGLVLSKVDLREYAHMSGEDKDLVVQLPSHVQGVPIVRIDAAALSRYNVRGIGVRLLVVPDLVTRVDTGAFSHVAAQTIFVGLGCEHFGSQPLELWDLRPAPNGRTYVVSSGNRWWQSLDGSVLSADGNTLVFLAPPYEKRTTLPQGITKVGADAFAKWDEAPQVVECDSTLERVGSRQWDGALWLCPPDAEVRRILLGRGVQLASTDVVLQGDCWYDFDGEDAVVVQGPPAPPTASQTFAHVAAASAKTTDVSAAPQDSASALARKVAHEVASSASLSVLREVDGHPVKRIAARALATAPHTLVLPVGLEEVGPDNACKGTHRLMLPQSLRCIGAHSFCSRELEGIVSIPASVLSIGEGCFEYGICRLEHTGTIVHVSANQLLSCFVERSDEEMAALRDADPAVSVPFDFARYDEMLCEGRSLPDRVGALVHRLASPQGLSSKTRDNLVAQLRDNAQEAMVYVAREGSSQTVARLFEAGFIDEGMFEEQIELLRRANRTDCVMLLMERHRAANEGQASIRSRFSL
ncbi:MAG: hypothetical protein J5804_00795 [Eggerthellaceae bacterium]|nr:hypothetical protein [Eggerthellaceae bacterium]